MIMIMMIKVMITRTMMMMMIKMMLELTPRLHSNIVLLASRRPEAAAAIARALESEETRSNMAPAPVVRSEPGQRRVHWTYNELGKVLHGESLLTVLNLLLTGRDAVWDTEDPLPWLLLNHLQVLYRTKLHCTLLFCTLLYCTNMYCTVLYCYYHIRYTYTLLQVPSLLAGAVWSGQHWDIVNFCLGQLR